MRRRFQERPWTDHSKSIYKHYTRYRMIRWPILAIDSARENLSHTRLTSPSRTSEQIRMSHLILTDSPHQRIQTPDVTNHIGKRLWTVHLRYNAIYAIGTPLFPKITILYYTIFTEILLIL